MLVVGVCGASGSGKSLLCSYLQKKGYSVADCDAIYRKIVTPPSDCLDEIVRIFGQSCRDDHGGLNREYLRSVVFEDPCLRKRLNEITFSYILKKVKDELDASREKGDPLFFIDAPLLFESGLDRMCDRTLLVTAGFETRLKRLLQRDGLSEEQLRARLRSQADDGVLRERCTDVLENNGELSSLYEGVEALLRSWGV